MADQTSSKSVKKFDHDKMSKYPNAYERETLKPSHMIALIRVWMFNETHKAVADSMGRGISTGTIGELKKSPAGKRFKEYLDQKVEDPVQFVKDIAMANTLGVTTDWYMALEWAKEARDYKSVAQMSKDLAALGGVQATPPKQEIETSKTIKIVFDGSDLDQEVLEADWEELADDDDSEDT